MAKLGLWRIVLDLALILVLVALVIAPLPPENMAGWVTDVLPFAAITAAVCLISIYFVFAKESKGSSE